MTQSDEQQELFLALLEPLYDRLERFCRVLTRNNEEAKDVLSDTLLEAYRSFGTLKNDKAFLSFLFTIAGRMYKRRFRKRRFAGEYDERSARAIPDRAPTPDVSADIALLYDAIGRLPEKQREAVIMFELLDLPLEDIRRIQGGTLSALKVRLMRARRRLTVMLHSHFDAGTQQAVQQTTTRTPLFLSGIRETL